MKEACGCVFCWQDTGFVWSKVCLAHLPRGPTCKLNSVPSLFFYISEAQQQLYVRLFLRKHHWIRMAKLSYKDIADDLTDIVQALVDNGFLLDSKN